VKQFRAPFLAGVFFAAVGVISGFVAASTNREPIRQPIAFNHRKHVKENGMACSDCHTSYQTETFSGLPGADTCSLCHGQMQGKSAEERKLVALLSAGGEPQWRTLFRQPPHIFYSHRRHVMKAGIACETCHGAIANTTTPPTAVRRLKMADCIDCHERRGVATDCTTCHR